MDMTEQDIGVSVAIALAMLVFAQRQGDGIQRVLAAAGQSEAALEASEAGL